jgi:RNA 3'-terminal phosphate cyclase (ATP)
MASRARDMLERLGVPLRIESGSLRAACAGAGIFLTAEYQNLRCGFSVLGERGKPAEQVAEDAVFALLAHWTSGAALDRHLANQIVVPLALAPGPSTFTVESISRHLETNAWVIELFGLAQILMEKGERGMGLVTVSPRGG